MHLLVLLLAALAAARPDDISFDGEEKAADETAATTTEAVDAAELGVRQASRQVNCQCQCSSITFLDKFGKINGNCRSSDNTGAVWCYVDPRFTQCADLQRSTRTTSLWSYQACATPDLSSPQCGGFGGNNGGFSGNNGGFGGNNGGFGGSNGNFGGSNGGFGGSTGGFGGSTGGFGGSTGGFGGSTGGFGGSTGGFGGSTGGFGGSSGNFGGSNGFNNGIPNNGFNTGVPNQGFQNNNGGFANNGIRTPSVTVGGLVGTGTNGFSVGSGAASGPEGFPFQENGGFQAVLSLAERKATAAKAGEGSASEAPVSESSDSVSFSR